jgi:hypothetical protein
LLSFVALINLLDLLATLSGVAQATTALHEAAPTTANTNHPSVDLKKMDQVDVQLTARTRQKNKNNTNVQ